MLSTWHASFGLAADLASSSDIQKKLRALFPLDYAKDHRKYRPSNDVNMKARFDHLRRCKRGRISKEKRLRHYPRGTFRTPVFKDLRQDSMGSCRNFAHAFRDYSTLSSYDIPIILSPDLVDSEPVISSLLLLDGSSLSPASTGSVSDMTRTTCIDNLSGKSPLDLRTSAALDSTSSPTRTHSKQLEISTTRERSIRGLGRQLADKYSESYLKHVDSIMRYSSSNSWRSSLTSISSRASSLLSRRSAHDKSNTEEASYSKHWERTGAPHPYNQKSTLSTLDEIEPMEQEVWNELIDEGKVGPRPRPPYLTVSPLYRKCCKPLAYPVCQRCGFTFDHRYAITCGQLDSSSENSFINRSDFYGNTPLHCAAAGVVQDRFEKLRHRSLLWPGVEVSRCNTMGETFLHILCRSGPRTPKDSADFSLLLMDLSVTDFPFSKRDCHGRTILHILFQYSDGKHSIEFLREILSIMKPDLSVKDNAGFCVQEYLEQFDQGTIYNRGLRALVTRTSALFHPPILPPNFHRNFFSYHDEKDLKAWLENNTEKITWIDNAGDNLLIAMLKFWAHDISRDWFLAEAAERMIQSGDVIHMRDRDGDTALAIAARRGFRPVVSLLIEKGAIVHSRNYRGVGILKQMEQTLASARIDGDTSLWSCIWSCQIALVDAGAIMNPTDKDEWMDPSSRLLVQK